MASDDEDPTATVYGEEEDLDEDESDEQEDLIINDDQNVVVDEEDVDLIDEEDDEDEENDSLSSAAGEVTIAVAGISNATTPITVTPTTTVTTPTTVRSDHLEPKKPVDDSRRLFQRLWTDEDEIELLQGFLDYTTQRGTNRNNNNNNSSHHHDTTAFYEEIKGKLQLDFNKNQLVEKLRRLKKKYRNVLAKTSVGKEFVFKSPHDQATFDLSCKIWSEPAVAGGGIDDEDPQNPNPNPNMSFNLNNENNGITDPNSSDKKAVRSRKRSRAVKIEENLNNNYNYSYNQGMGTGGLNSNPVMVNNPVVSTNLVEETVKSCLLPLFKELVNGSSNGGCGNGNSVGSGLGLRFGGMNVNLGIGDMGDEKWRKQHILELEVYSKRLELMQDEIKARLEELRSMGS